MRVAGDTIFAPSSGAGRSAVCVIRISGPRSHGAIKALTGRMAPPVRQLIRKAIITSGGEVVDDAMVVVFPEGASFTGEAMAEIHCHGGRAVVSAVLNLLGGLDGCRMAEPGEFSYRAFSNGKILLSEAEGTGDLISAETELQRRAAMRLKSGGLDRLAASWREKLLTAAALVELTIDWADEEVPEDVMPEVRSLLAEVHQGLQDELLRSQRSERLRSGFEVAIVGAPNAGKSSLLNTLAGRDAAIISDEPGTTRDVLEVRYDLNGLPLVFLDMAGLRETTNAVEKIGVSRAEERARLADLRLHVASVDAPYPDEYRGLFREGDLQVWSKADLAPGAGDVIISTRCSEGLDELLEAIEERLGHLAVDIGLLGHARHRDAVDRAANIIGTCMSADDSVSIEILAEEIRRAVAALEQLIGVVGVEDLLDVVFGRFCLGK